MKPVIQIWILHSGLPQINRGNFPSSWWHKTPARDDVVCINVTYDWYQSLLQYERKIQQDDLPF
jgi:hypothetical protein